MVKSQTTSITPSQHAANHVAGGTDPLVYPILPSKRYDPYADTAMVLEDTNEYSQGGTAWTKVWEKTLDSSHTPELGFRYDYKRSGGTAHFKIYRNGVGVGDDVQCLSAVYATSPDEYISGWTNGDKIQIYVSSNVGADKYVKNVEIFGGLSALNQVPIWS